MSWQCSTPSISRQLYAICQQIKLSSNSARHLSNSSREWAESVASSCSTRWSVQPVQKYFWSGIFEIMPHALALGLLPPSCYCCFVPHTYTICTGIYSGSQPIQPASQPFRRPSVHPAVCLSIQTVSRCSCQRSILQFIIIVIDSFEWLQWQTGLPSVDRGRERALVHAVTALLSIYLGLQDLCASDMANCQKQRN